MEHKNRFLFSIFKYTFIQLAGFTIYYIIGSVLPSIYPSPVYVPLVIFMLICFPTIGFVLLGYHLNRKNDTPVTYGQFVKLGVIVAFLTSVIFLLTSSFFRQFIDVIPWESYISDIKKRGVYTVVGLTFIMTIECLIVAAFRKKLK